MATMHGTIKRLVSDKGFGFVRPTTAPSTSSTRPRWSDGSFDHLREGQALTFDKGQGPKGPRAENVRVA